MYPYSLPPVQVPHDPASVLWAVTILVGMVAIAAITAYWVTRPHRGRHHHSH